MARSAVGTDVSPVGTTSLTGARPSKNPSFLRLEGRPPCRPCTFNRHNENRWLKGIVRRHSICDASPVKFFLILAGALLLAEYTHAAPVRYTLSGRLVYQGTYPLGTWQGTNTTVSGQLAGDSTGGSLTGAVQATVAAWESGNSVRDQHTRAMFDTVHHPTARFVVTELKAQRAGDPAILRGALTLHGVTMGTLLGVLPAALLYLWLRARTGSLIAPVVVHNLWNLSVYFAHL